MSKEFQPNVLDHLAHLFASGEIAVDKYSGAQVEIIDYWSKGFYEIRYLNGLWAGLGEKILVSGMDLLPLEDDDVRT